MKTKALLFSAAAILLFSSNTWSSEIARSSEKKVSFIELFSSESCSSCPPADQWFSRLKSSSSLWKDFVPAVFHVDYWNHLDWKDDFSSREMTERQQAHASTWLVPRVYTPGVVLNGQEWIEWRGRSNVPAETVPTVGRLVIENLSGKYRITFSSTKKLETAPTFHIALLGMGLKNKITSGENSGSLLAHDFVVLVWKHRSSEKQSNGDFVVTFDDLKSDKKTTSRAVIAWVQDGSGPRALQVTGNYLK